MLFATTAPQSQWWVAIPSITLIDVVLAGDNALVIALAVRQLKPSQRLAGSALGAGLAVLLRVGLTFFAGRLLALDYIKLVGGALVLWIAVKLIGAEEETDQLDDNKTAAAFWSTVRLILIADLSMSIDNVLAVAAASHGSLPLILFGLALSIPLIVFTSNFLARMMERYPIIAWLGAALLGKVAGEMIVVDRFFFPDSVRAPSGWLVHGAGLAGALAVVLIGWALRVRRSRGGTRA